MIEFIVKIANYNLITILYLKCTWITTLKKSKFEKEIAFAKIKYI